MGREELLEHQRALVGEHAADHLRAVVEPAVAYDVPERTDRAGLVVVGAEDHPRDPGQDCRAGAHRARLERHDECAALQTPLPVYGGSLTQRHDLGVGGGVPDGLPLVVTAADDLAVRAEHDRADGDVAGVGSSACFGEGLPHGVDPLVVPDHQEAGTPTVSSNWAPNPTLAAMSASISSGYRS